MRPRASDLHEEVPEDDGRAAERALVARLRAGDASAFPELVLAHQDRVFSIAFRMLGDRAEAEDLAQEIFLAIHRGLPNFRGESRLSTWIHRVARNQTLNRCKYLALRGGDGRTQSLDELPADRQPATDAPDELMARQEAQRLVQDALATLSEEHRMLVVLRDLEGLSYEELVEVTQEPIGTVKSRLHRARLALGRELASRRAAREEDR